MLGLEYFIPHHIMASSSPFPARATAWTALAVAGTAVAAYVLFAPRTAKKAGRGGSSSTSSAADLAAELAAVKAELAVYRRHQAVSTAKVDTATPRAATRTPSDAAAHAGAAAAAAAAEGAPPSSSPSLSSPTPPLSSSIIKPPLPPTVVQLLNASQLCFLSTSFGNDPHLSLMNFTYYQPEEVVIMCTKRDTKKFRQIMQSSSVALLIHDFPHLKLEGSVEVEHVAPNADSGRTFSITLNGIAEVCVGQKAEWLRNIHLAANPDYAQFIQRDDVLSTASGEPCPAVFVVRIESARICNVQDKVNHWNARTQEAAVTSRS